jgi:hypothetical protein
MTVSWCYLITRRIKQSAWLGFAWMLRIVESQSRWTYFDAGWSQDFARIDTFSGDSPTGLEDGLVHLLYYYCTGPPMPLPASESEPLISGSNVSVWGGNDRWSPGLTSRHYGGFFVGGNIFKTERYRSASLLIMYRLGVCSVSFGHLLAASMIDSSFCCRS